ncbi:DNA repair exonuclease [Thiohalocapsa marina]|uniref:DNA repair exonuclease n=1 Tax=Thiohalocapsa marina TaxID=424902 RepID=A0A5M8FSH5_9GAMM|nr:DNA repair exonuclease [Thiohalocapsa marina]KAA6185072.1 DNA repair exonuclease [Thiohalocapsa marina]
MPFRFIHTSDLHLGRRFANIPEPADNGVRGRLMDARHTVIRRLAQAARTHGARHVLLAGDTFDSATPSPQVLRQMLAEMREQADVHWWLLPGNHDNLRSAEPVWEAIRRDAPSNVRPILDTSVLQPAPGVHVLPCPVPVRAAGRDLTASMPATATPAGALRIGLAHGGVLDFTDSGEHIPPDRDRSAGLDYLALGDWHGRLAVTPRTHYPGTPEPDRFKHPGRGRCLAVSIDGPGAEPDVREIETATFAWIRQELPLHQGESAADALEALLPTADRRNTLLRIIATGWASPAAHAALGATCDRHRPEFAYFDLQSERLGTLHSVSDLDQIARSGAIRLAAEALMHEADDDQQPEDTRDIASAALNRLYAYAREAAE